MSNFWSSDCSGSCLETFVCISYTSHVVLFFFSDWMASVNKQQSMKCKFHDIKFKTCFWQGFDLLHLQHKMKTKRLSLWSEWLDRVSNACATWRTSGINCKIKQQQKNFKKELHGISGERGLRSLFGWKDHSQKHKMINRMEVWNNLAMEWNGTCAIIHFTNYLDRNYGFHFYW